MIMHESLGELLITMALSVVMVVSCVLVHYEALRGASIIVPKLTIPPRSRILFVIGAAFLAHSLEIWLMAAEFYVLAEKLGLGSIAGTFGGTFYEYLYYSTVSYTSLGIGDLYPTGVLRILTGVEALLGLAMIAWTGSFTYLAMEKFWSLHRTRTD